MPSPRVSIQNMVTWKCLDFKFRDTHAWLPARILSVLCDLGHDVFWSLPPPPFVQWEGLTRLSFFPLTFCDWMKLSTEKSKWGINQLVIWRHVSAPSGCCGSYDSILDMLSWRHFEEFFAFFTKEPMASNRLRNEFYFYHLQAKWLQTNHTVTLSLDCLS